MVDGNAICTGLSINTAIRWISCSPQSASFSCFVNFLKSEEARKRIILIVDGPAARKAEALPQPQYRLETCDRSPG
ncbi:hypothetical protein ACVIKP_005209 [Rhizobium leguminosarum]